MQLLTPLGSIYIQLWTGYRLEPISTDRQAECGQTVRGQANPCQQFIAHSIRTSAIRQLSLLTLYDYSLSIASSQQQQQQPQLGNDNPRRLLAVLHTLPVFSPHLSLFLSL